MNEKTAKIKYLENGTFKEMEVEEAIKEILDYIYPDKEYEYFSKGLLEDEINIIKKTLAFVKEKKSTERLRFLVLKKQVENKLKWLLNEIEKEIKKHDKYEEELREKGLYHEALEELGFVSGLNVVKMLIKKAFSGVTEK